MSWKREGKCANDATLLAWMKETRRDFFYDRMYERSAKAYCNNGCPVINECKQEGLTHSPGSLTVPQGIWGGLTERERRSLLRNLNKRLAVLQERLQKQLQGDDFPNAS